MFISRLKSMRQRRCPMNQRTRSTGTLDLSARRVNYSRPDRNRWTGRRMCRPAEPRPSGQAGMMACASCVLCSGSFAAMASGGHTARCDKELPRPGILKPLCWTSETAYLSSPQNACTNTVACPVAFSFLPHTPWTMPSRALHTHAHMEMPARRRPCG